VVTRGIKVSDLAFLSDKDHEPYQFRHPAYDLRELQEDSSSFDYDFTDDSG
jgi:hypothetical protein